jgi:hypothetical protein
MGGTLSARGRTEWRNLAMKAGNMLELGEEICSTRRKALRARLAAGDHLVLLRLCAALVDTLTLYRIVFIDVSERRAANAEELKALRTIIAELKSNKPLLNAALRAVQPL